MHAHSSSCEGGGLEGGGHALTFKAMADRGDGRPAPAAAADADCTDDPAPFAAWASAQRRRAALDGAWRVEVSERCVHGVRIRSVTSWHNAPQQHTSSRRVPPQRDERAGSEARQAACQHPRRQSARQRRSALRSAAHHRRVRLRLRSHLLAVRFLVRLSRLCTAARAQRLARDAQSTLKRRHSPSPTPPDRPVDDDDAALPPPPKRLEVSEMVKLVLRRVGIRKEAG